MNIKDGRLNICSHRPSAESLVLKANKFHYDLDANRTFTNWSEKCKGVFHNNRTIIPDD